MKAAFIALGLTVATMADLITPAVAQVVIHEDQSPDDDSARDETESNFLHTWNRHHEARNRWGERRDNFGLPATLARIHRRRRIGQNQE